MAVAVIAMAACTQSPAGPAPPAQAAACNYQVSPTRVGLAFAGGPFTVSVNADAGSTCQWTASTADAWIHFAGTHIGQGLGVLTLNVDANSLLARFGTVTVNWTGGTASIDVTQVCGPAAVTQTVNLRSERQTYLVGVGIPTGGCTFIQADPIQFDVPWMSFVSTHVGGSQLEFGVDRNTGPERTGHVITAIGIITVVQSAGNL